MENINKQVEDKLKNTDDKKKEQILADFSVFINYLGDKVEIGEKMGLSEERIAQLAEKVAGYLAKKEDPKTVKNIYCSAYGRLAIKNNSICSLTCS